MPASPFAPVQFGKYTLVERIASGGMAEVYKAVLRGAAGFEKTVALKRILPIFNEERDFIALFQDEARTASTLTHANLVQTFDFGEEGGSYYLALELVEGADLARLCERLRAAGQPFPTATAAFVVAEAARGLAYAHDKRGPDGLPLGIVHRDVSPQNILLSYAGEVKIADFGIAKAARKVHRTMTGMVMGKLKYMSPEQVAGDPLDGRSDVFSLGVILYELLTGGVLFPEAGSAVAELIHAAPIPPPSARAPGVPAELDAIVMKALGRPKEKRYARAADLARDLSVWLNTSSPGFTREDLAALVTRVYPPQGQPVARTGTVLGSGVSGLSPARKPPATIVGADEAGRVGPGPALDPTSALRKKPATTPPPQVVVGSFDAPEDGALDRALRSPLPSGNRTIANPADPDVDPRARTEMVRELDIPTRTRLDDVGTMTQSDVALPATRPANPTVRADVPPRMTSRTEPALRRRKALPAATVVILALVAVILGSGALVLLRFVLPGREAQLTPPATVDAGTAVVPAGDAAVAAAREPDAAVAVAVDAGASAASALPFVLTPTLTDEKQRDALAKKITDRRASRGVHDGDYELFLAALDFRVATLIVDGNGHAEPGAPLPLGLQVSIAERQLTDTLDQVSDYLRRAGDLPPQVRAAAKKYLRGRPAWDPEHGVQIATLAAWLDDENHAARLVELARQNDGLGRWCTDRLPAPRHRFAALACEPGALAAELRAAGDEASAAAIDRWQSAPVKAMRAPWTVELLSAQWGAPSAPGREVRLQLKVAGGPRPAPTAFTLLAGGASAPIAATAGGEVDAAAAEDAGPSGGDAGAAAGAPLPPPLVFVLPRGAFAPVVQVDLPGSAALTVRVTPPR